MAAPWGWTRLGIAMFERKRRVAEGAATKEFTAER